MLRRGKRLIAATKKQLQLEQIFEESDVTMSVRLEHLSLRQMVQLCFGGLLMLALGAGTIGDRLPERFAVAEWPTARCPSPSASFNDSCAGVDMARGESFEFTLNDVHVEWQNLLVSARVYNLDAEEHGIIATKPMEQRMQVRRSAGARGAKGLHWP